VKVGFDGNGTHALKGDVLPEQETVVKYFRLNTPVFLFRCCKLLNSCGFVLVVLFVSNICSWRRKGGD